MVTIRQAEKKDCVLIVDLIKALAVYEKAATLAKATPEQIEKTFFSGKARVYALIAEADGVPAGFAVYFFNYSTWLAKYGLYLEDLFVLEKNRRQGIGQALLQELAIIAEKNDCHRLEWQVLDWNKLAIDFYDKLGGRAQSQWLTYRLDEKGIADLAHLDR